MILYYLVDRKHLLGIEPLLLDLQANTLPRRSKHRFYHKAVLVFIYIPKHVTYLCVCVGGVLINENKTNACDQKMPQSQNNIRL